MESVRSYEGTLRATLSAMRAPPQDPFLESLMDTSLYSMGAYFTDEHTDLVDAVIEQSVAIEELGLRGYAAEHDLDIEECFQTLMTGLAVRYYKAVAG